MSSSVPFVTAAVGFAILASASVFAAPTHPKPDRRAFEFEMHRQLEGTVMGYSFVLMKDGQILAEGAGGKARNAADGSRPMTTSTPQNVGSLFKFISGVTLLSIIDDRGVPNGPKNLNAALDFPYYLALPRFWTKEIKIPEIKTVSIRRVLQHRSGLRSDRLISSFREDFDPKLIGVRDYQNVNFRLTGYMVASLSKPDVLTQMDTWDTSSPLEERYKVSQNVLGVWMDKHIRTVMQTKIPGKPVASCDGANEFKTTGAYAYKSKNDTGKGIITSRLAAGEPCIGSGGYMISARHLALFASTALHTNRLLSDAARAEMMPSRNTDNRLVWSSVSDSKWGAENYGERFIYGSGGRQPYDDGQVACGSLVRMPGGYVVVTLANSGEWGSDDLGNFSFKAFTASVK